MVNKKASWVARELEFHERAIEAVGGYDNFGGDEYLEGMRRVLYSYDEEARWHPVGRLTAEYQLMNLMTSRLRTERWFELRPQHREVKIERPLVITGMVRTGSTALHYLMGANPDMQCLQYWLGLNPQPRPPRAGWEANKDYQQATAELAGVYAAGSKLEAIHHMTAPGPDECGRMLAQSFTDDRFEVVNTMPSYSKWYKEAYHGATYARHKRMVQLIGSYDTERRWLLKYPVHMRHLDALLDTYPDACVIWTHRDPATVLPSYVSLVEGFRGLMERSPDRTRIAEEQLECWADALSKGLELRKGREHQFHDVFFGDFMSDPIGTVEAAYAKFDVEFSDEARVALQAWRDGHQPGKFGKHIYSRDDFGLSREDIHARAADYLAAFPHITEERHA